ncbi:MAG TPA: pseudouridine synthase, partial [Kofleriaceae bacterium]
MATPVRLQRYLAAAGVAARRKAEDLITAGRVTVNGAVVTQLGSKVDPDRDQVTVDGEAVVPLDHFYALFNKPKACITAVTDDRGRMTVMDYLPNLPVPVKPVGRLDFYTEGVLLLTNDGELAAKLLAPASHVPKTYHVKVHGQMRPEHVKTLRNGVELDDGTVTLPAEIEVLPGESKHTWLAITIHEGKHRQIHRMVEALGYYVDKLQRVAFANLTFHHLRVGDARELTQQELNQLRDLVGLDHSAVARGRWSSQREDTDIPRRAHMKALAEAEEAAALAADGAPTTTQPGEGDDDREDAWEWQGSGRGPRHDTGAYPGGPRRDAGGDRGGPRRDAGGDRGGPRRDAGGDRGGPRRDAGGDRGGPRRDAGGDRGGPRRDAGGDRGGPR